MPERTVRRRLEENDGRGFKAMMITGVVLLALVFPVQAIAMFVLLTAAMTCIGIYNTVLSHHAMQKRRRRLLNHAVGDVTIGVLGLGSSQLRCSRSPRWPWHSAWPSSRVPPGAPPGSSSSFRQRKLRSSACSPRSSVRGSSIPRPSRRGVCRTANGLRPRTATENPATSALRLRLMTATMMSSGETDLDELSRLALAADPDVALDDDAVSLWDVDGFAREQWLPEWYMPTPMRGLRSFPAGGRAGKK